MLVTFTFRKTSTQRRAEALLSCDSMTDEMPKTLWTAWMAQCWTGGSFEWPWLVMRDPPKITENAGATTTGDRTTGGCKDGPGIEGEASPDRDLVREEGTQEVAHGRAAVRGVVRDHDEVIHGLEKVVHGHVEVVHDHEEVAHEAAQMSAGKSVVVHDHEADHGHLEAQDHRQINRTSKLLLQ